MLISDNKASASERKIYQGIIRSLIFSMLEIRPDITCPILVMSTFVKNPSCWHTKSVILIFQYYKRSKDRDIIYRGQENLFFMRYSGSNRVGNEISQKSILG